MGLGTAAATEDTSHSRVLMVVRVVRPMWWVVLPPPEKHEPLCRVLSAVSGASFTPVCTSVGVKGGVSLSVVVVVCVQPMMVRVECLQMVGT